MLEEIKRPTSLWSTFIQSRPVFPYWLEQHIPKICTPRTFIQGWREIYMWICVRWHDCCDTFIIKCWLDLNPKDVNRVYEKLQVFQNKLS